MIYGYARVSTATQGRDGNSLEDQVAALEKYGCQKIIEEAFSGKTMERPQFTTLFQKLQPGDTLVMLGDIKRGLAIPPKSMFDKFSHAVFESEEDAR